MATQKAQPAFTLHGPVSYRLRSVANLLVATLSTPVRRLLRGPRHPGWPGSFETTMRFLRAQTEAAEALADLRESRLFEDSLVFASAALPQVAVSAAGPGRWFEPAGLVDRPAVLLYLHGGGFAYASQSHDNLIALVALATGLRTFAAHYRLAPEHVYPAQLDDARAAYCWLVQQGYRADQIVVAGDSAGGNLALALLLDLKAAGEPLPAAAVCLAPWTDLANPGASMLSHDGYDWISARMAARWSAAYRGGFSATDPRVSPAWADLRGLPPIYIQAGGAEILLDMIRAFHARAQAQGADIRLDVWEAMTHDFQAFGSLLPEARDALDRIGQFVAQRLDANPTSPGVT